MKFVASLIISDDIFQTLMIEKNFFTLIKSSYSSISTKLSSDVTTLSLVLTLAYFSLLDIDLCCFGNRPRRL